MLPGSLYKEAVLPQVSFASLIVPGPSAVDRERHRSLPMTYGARCLTEIPIAVEGHEQPDS